MSVFIRNIFFVLVLMFSMSTQANGLQKEDPIVSKTKKSLVNHKEVQEVFMKIKRVENILSPKKKLRKKKYTIA